MSVTSKLLGFLGVLFLAASAEAALDIDTVAHRCDAAGTATDCPAPLYVYFDGEGSSCDAGECTDGWATLDHHWDFDEADPDTWVFSNQSMGEAFGPIAFHVFEEPGAYTVTHTITARDGTTTNETVTITVDDPDDLTTHCISNTADFTDCPVGATETTASTFGSAITTAYNAGARRILFHAGHSFSGAPSLPGNGPAVVGVFGTGRVTVTGSGGWGSNGRNDWRFVDIDFVFTTTDAMNLQSEDNWLFLRDSFGPYSSVMSFGDGSAHNALIGNSQSHFVLGNSATFGGLPCIWAPKYGSTVAGMYMSNCTRLVREDFDDDAVVDGQIYQHNKFTGKRNSNAIELRGVEEGDTNYLDKTLVSFNWFGIDDNSGCDGGNCRAIVLYGDGGGGAGAPFSRLNRTLIENNVMADGTEVQLRTADRATLIRNNLFEDHINDVWRSQIQLNAVSDGLGGSGWQGGTRIYNNTFHMTSTDFPSVIYLNDAITDACSSSACDVRNNLVWSTTSASYDAASVPTGSTETANASRNLSDTYDLLDDPLVDSTPNPLNPDEWELRSGTRNPDLTNGPTSMYVIRDYKMRFRPQNSAAIGAMGGNTAPPDPGLEVRLTCSPDGGSVPVVGAVCTATFLDIGTGPDYRLEFDYTSDGTVDETVDIADDATPGPISTPVGDADEHYDLVGNYTATVTVKDYANGGAGVGAVVATDIGTDTMNVQPNASVCPVTANAGVQKIELWDATNDVLIDSNFQSGDHIPAANRDCFAFVADGNSYLDAGGAGSVHYSINSGSTPATKCESTGPYAYPSDTGTNQYDCGASTTGAHTVTVTPYDADGCTGTSGLPLTINFTTD